MKEHKYNNTVIQSKGGEHGKRVIEWWKEQGVNTRRIDGKNVGWCYGLIDGEFTCFRKPTIPKIIELPESNPQDLIGRKVRGFRFDEKDKLHWWREEMEKYIGIIGQIRGVSMDNIDAVVRFPNDVIPYRYPLSLIHEHLVEEEKVKPHSFCKETGENCTMSYCDENGCLERKRNLVDVDTSEQNMDTSPQIIDLTNVEGVEMMVSDDEEYWFKVRVIAKYKDNFIESNCDSWNFAKPIKVKKVTMKQVEEKFGCKVEIVKEVSND